MMPRSSDNARRRRAGMCRLSCDARRHIPCSPVLPGIPPRSPRSAAFPRVPPRSAEPPWRPCPLPRPGTARPYGRPRHRGRADRTHVDNRGVADSRARDSWPEGAARGRRGGGAVVRRRRLRPAGRLPRPRALPHGRHQPVPRHRHRTGPAGEAGPVRQPRAAAGERDGRAAPAVLRPRRPCRRARPAHRPHRAARRRRRARPARLAGAQRRGLLPGDDRGADGPRPATAHHHQGPDRSPTSRTRTWPTPPR